MSTALTGMGVSGCGSDILDTDRPDPLSIATDSLPDGMVGVTYEAQFRPFSGFEPYFWSRVGGFLPIGLELSQEGLLSGTPTLAREYSFLIRVTDGVGAFADASFTVTITEGLTIGVQEPLPTAQVGLAYTATVGASGGSGEGYTWTVSQGDLPDGLMLTSTDTATSAIDGTPTVAGTFDFTLELEDDLGTTTSTTISLEVLP